MSQNKTQRRRIRKASPDFGTELLELAKLLQADDSQTEELLQETVQWGNEEADIAEESTGIPVSEVQDQNEKANDNWPVTARQQIASRLLKLAKRLLEAENEDSDDDDDDSDD